MTNISNYDIFISYSREDSEATAALSSSLAEAGLRVWFDRWALVPGESWDKAISKALESSTAVAVVVGPSGLGPWQEREIQAVLEKQGSDRRPRVIPVLLPGSSPEQLPNFLRDRMYLDLREDPTDARALSRLVTTIDGAKSTDPIDQEQKIGDNLRAAGDIHEAGAHYERALKIARATYGESHPTVVDLLLKIGTLRQDQGDYSAALALLSEAMAGAQNLFGSDSSKLASAYNNIGSVLRDRGELDEALMYFQKALAIEEHVLGPHHPVIAGSLNNMAAVMRARGQFQVAVEMLTRAIEIERKLLGSQHPDLAMTLNNLGNVLYEHGEKDSALRAYHEALSIFQSLMGDEHPYTKKVQENVLKATAEDRSQNTQQ